MVSNSLRHPARSVVESLEKYGREVIAKALLSRLSGLCLAILRAALDLSRFDTAPLIAFIATKETDYGTETDGRIPQGRCVDRVDQWADAQAGG